MKNSNYFLRSFLDALGVLAYVTGIAWLLFNGEKIFGNSSNFLIPVFMLLLFIISALITGLLVLGKPIHLYLSGLKKESFILLFATLGWMLLFLLGIMILFQTSFVPKNEISSVNLPVSTKSFSMPVVGEFHDEDLFLYDGEYYKLETPEPAKILNIPDSRITAEFRKIMKDAGTKDVWFGLLASLSEVIHEGERIEIVGKIDDTKKTVVPDTITILPALKANYTNKELGFSLEIPEGFAVEGEDGYYTVRANPTPENDVPMPDVLISVTNGTNTKLALDKNQNFVGEDEVEINGIKGTKTLVSDLQYGVGNICPIYRLWNNGKIYEFTLNECLESDIFERVVKSFQIVGK